MKKLLLIFAVFVLIVIFGIGSVLAAVTTSPESGSSTTTLEDYQKALKEPAINLQQFSFFNLDYTAYGLTKLIVGVPQEETTASLPSAQKSPQNYGAFGLITSTIGTMYTQKPVSAVDYFANVGRNLGFIKPAYAQGEGFGFTSLQPVVHLWQIMRNLSYLVFVLIFVLVGFMIMLRTRIDPRTVTTVQAAIPGIVVALILVTFSFAIAGLVVDLTELSTRLLANILTGQFRDINSLITAIKENPNYNIFGLMFSLIEPTGDSASNIVKQIISAIPGAIANLLETIAGSGLGQSIIGLFFGILIVFTAFRVFIMLLTALVTIVLMTIFAPLMFLGAAIPGRGGVVVGWFRSILSAALTFPVTFGLLLFAAIFLGATASPWNVIDKIDNFNLSLVPLGVFKPKDANVIPIAQLIGLGILLMTPKATDMINQALSIRAPEWAGEAGRAIGRFAGRLSPF